MKVLLSVLFLLTFSLTASAEVIETTGNLRNLIADVTATMRQVAGPGTHKFSVPTLAQMSTWREAIRAVLAGNLPTADQQLAALASSYKVVQFIDETTGRPYFLLIEAEVTGDIVPIIKKGWGTFIFDPDAWRELSIQVPHPLFDSGTEGEGIEAFLQLGARSFLMAGTHRCANTRFSRCSGTTTACSEDHARLSYRISDVSHSPTNMFHQTHKEIMRWTPGTVAIQLHGNNQRRPDGQPACPNVLISNSNSNYTAMPDGNVRRLANSFDIPSVGICDPRPNSCNLCGTDNVQGRFTNGSPSPCDRSAHSPDELFIHIEQNRDFRQNFTPLIEALQRAFP